MLRVISLVANFQLQEALRHACQHRGLWLEVAGSPVQAVERCLAEAMALVCLEEGLVHEDLPAFCERLRAAADHWIMLAGKGLEPHVELGAYAAGIDEVVPLPLRPGVLAGLLGRRKHRLATDMAEPGTSQPLTVGPFHLEPLRLEVEIAHLGTIRLTPLETRLMGILMRHAGQVLRKQRILQMLWGHQDEAGAVLLKTHIRNLRLKIEAQPSRPSYLRTIAGVGYTLAPGAALPMADLPTIAWAPENGLAFR